MKREGHRESDNVKDRRAQRQRWFDKGLEKGSVKGCDTFSARQL